jgi:hypothetical protein
LAIGRERTGKESSEENGWASVLSEEIYAASKREDLRSISLVLSSDREMTGRKNGQRGYKREITWVSLTESVEENREREKLAYLDNL